uniref:NADH-ubiquinone oxidoreductase chain 2 n=1 Tax=Eucinetus haemorrhoidalis TaxID=1490181 RepID=A0A343A4A5_9COLE|nr:NADH dehydrogenase subunit 2 [Eucinetus haemorrhoidalis]AOY39383.1 NADH dehydrogenase subunit 2 [Eucinetus haemorrhoidalis]
MNNFMKMFFFLLMITGILISISSNSWLMTWMGLEINMMAFIPIINNNNLKTIYFSETSMKYFLIQAFSSLIFLMSIILLNLKNNFMISIYSNYWNMIMNTALMMKMGAAPLHFWIPEIMEKLSWINNLILMTVQKITPMLLLWMNYNQMLFMNFFIISSVMIGSLGGITQLNLNKIMAYSSINHTGWMLASLIFSKMTWLIYYIIYTIISMSIILTLNNLNVFHLKSMFNLKMNYLMKFSFALSILSLGGLPPFLGFIPKWLIIQNLTNLNYYFTNLIMIMTSLIMLFFYLRLSISLFILPSNKLMINSNYYNQNKFMPMFMFMNIMGLPMCTLLINM